METCPLPGCGHPGEEVSGSNPCRRPGADIELDLVAHKARRGGETVPLGPTERELLRHFLERPGRVFSRERLLQSVWGDDSDIELRTIDVHIRRLRKAVNAGGKADLIRTVRSAGYALDDDAG